MKKLPLCNVSAAFVRKGLQNMFKNDRLGALYLINARMFVIFEHSFLMGNAGVQKLFGRLKTQRVTDPGKAIREFSDYKVTLNSKDFREFKTVDAVRIRNVTAHSDVT